MMLRRYRRDILRLGRRGGRLRRRRLDAWSERKIALSFVFDRRQMKTFPHDCVAAGAVVAAGARVEVLVPPAEGERSSMAIEPPVEVDYPWWRAGCWYRRSGCGRRGCHRKIGVIVAAAGRGQLLAGRKPIWRLQAIGIDQRLCGYMHALCNAVDGVAGHDRIGRGIGGCCRIVGRSLRRGLRIGRLPFAGRGDLRTFRRARSSCSPQSAIARPRPEPMRTSPVL